MILEDKYSLVWQSIRFVTLLLLKVFRYSFPGTISIFFNRIKSVFFLVRSIFTSNWLWIGICENEVLSNIDITMTTIKQNFEIDKSRILFDLDQLLKIQH